LAPRLDPARFDVTVLCRARRGEYLAELEAAGIAVLEFGSEGPLYGPRSLGTIRRLAGWLREGRIDVLHSFLFECNIQGILAAKLVGAPLRSVAGLRNMDDKYSDARMAPYVWLLRRADGVVAVCEAVRTRYVERGLPHAKVTVVENGVPAEDHHGPEHRLAAAAALGGAIPGPPLVVVLASLHSRKGLEHLLKAAKIVLRSIPDARFVVAGEGPERAKLEASRRELGLDGRVEFPGSIRPVRELLAAADLFVLSSLEEGISNALLEAQSEGVAAVVTDVGGNAEVVEHGRTGLVVRPADPEALAGAIARLLASADERLAMGAAAAMRSRETFGLERMTSRMEAYYEGLARAGERVIPSAR
jgi:glycosyltransferase involved in cell wall biosynthesis